MSQSKDQLIAKIQKAQSRIKVLLQGSNEILTDAELDELDDLTYKVEMWSEMISLMS